MKKILLLIVLLIGALAVATYCYTQINTSIIYQVKPGANITSIANDLKKQEVINSSDLFIYLARLQNINPKAGYYQITKMKQFFDDVDNGNILTDTITLLPGQTTKEYYEFLKNSPSVNTTRSLENIIKELDISKSYEGKFLADSFNILYGDSALSILKRSHELYQKKLSEVWQQRLQNPYIKTPYDLTILASIVEKESGNEAEKSIITGVFINRLKKNMPLQSDSTTIYALKKMGTYNGNLTKENLQTQSPYNTYTIKGLPIGAISNVSKNTLLATSKPTKHEYYYFVAKSKTAHAFTKTYAEHRKNIRRFLRKKRGFRF